MHIAYGAVCTFAQACVTYFTWWLPNKEGNMATFPLAGPPMSLFHLAVRAFLGEG